MTDKPDRSMTPGDDRIPGDPDSDMREADIAQEGEGVVEPGLVVEHDDEIELDERPEAEPADVDADAGAEVGAESAEAVDDPEPDDDPEPEPSEEPETGDDPDPDESSVEVDEPDDAVLTAPVARETTPADAGDGGNGTWHGESDGDEPSAHWGRRIVLGLAAVLAVLYVGGYFLTGSRMPANATIGGVDVSGKSPAAARSAVDEARRPTSIARSR